MKKEYTRKILQTFCLIYFLIQGCKQAQFEEGISDTGENSTLHDLNISGTRLKVEIAALSDEQARGLMFRDKLESGTGMLFIFKKGAARRFWMKNTRIPLDIGYFSSSGHLLEVHKGKPHDTSGVPSRSTNIKFVLELGEGEFKKLGLNLGDRLKINDLGKLLKQRGLNPEAYEIND